MAIFNSKIFPLVAFVLAVPATAEAVNCPQGTLPQQTIVRGSEIVITDTPVGLHCHAAMLTVSLVNPKTGTVSTTFDAEIDTGADHTIATVDFVQGLGLDEIGSETILQAGVAGAETPVRHYIAQVQTATGKQVDVRLMVTREKMSKLILGRDFLSNFTLTYDGKLGLLSLK